MDNRQLELEAYVKEKLKEYKRFMEYSGELPIPQIIIEEGLLGANHNYNVATDKHVLTFGPNATKKVYEPVLYHEFTHLYDVVTYSAKDSNRYFMNRGYTEYHASQVDLLKLLGATSIEEKITYSLSQQVDTIEGTMPLVEYILMAKNSAKEGLELGLHLTNKHAFSHIIGMVFNHLGRLSVCRLYAEDYSAYKDKLADLSVEKKILGEEFSMMVKLSENISTKNDMIAFGIWFRAMILRFADKYQLF